MVLLTVQELEMATPGEADSPPASTEEAASPIPSPPFASPVAEALDMLPALPSNRTLPPLQRVPPSMASSPVEEDVKMDDPEPLIEEPPDDEEQPAEEPSAPAEEVMDAPEPGEEEEVVEEPVVSEVASEDAADAPEDKQEEEQETAAVETFAEKMIASAEDVIETAQEEVQQTADTLGNKVAKFFGNLRKVKSLLHINEKVAEEEEEQTKNLSSSTGDLDMAAVRKSRACNIL